MSARLAHVFRHPIKSHGREALDRVTLEAGRCLPFDRHWAVAHDAARLEPGWNDCVHFSRGAKAPSLQGIAARLDTDTATLTLSHPDRPDLTFRPDEAADVPRFLDWVRPLVPADRAQPARIVAAGRGMTDTDYESISILSMASNRALGQRLGKNLDLGRWRGNLWLEGLAPWEEFELVGRVLTIGEVTLEVIEPITRCRATMANAATGRIDADTLGALNEGLGHQDFGVYARVVQGGSMAVGDPVTW